MKPTRRTVLHHALAAVAAPALGPLAALSVSTPAAAQNAVPAADETSNKWRHGLSLFGEPKYPAGFPRFDYVNPAAPKGGSVRMIAFGTFDNFNPVVAGVRGSLAAGINELYETLMVPALDEISTEYGLLAEGARYPDDYSSVTYRLRAEAKWHDGRPVSVDDVIFSFDTFRKNHPFYSAYYQHVTKVEKSGDREVTFRFDQPGNRELPHIVGQLRVLPKHWWQDKDANGTPRDVTKTTLERPLGSGVYRIKDFAAGRTIVFERFADYWGKALPVRVGQDNFDELRFEYFRDTTVALEAFKGDRVDWRTENSAKNWATAYDFPAVREARVVKEEFPIRDVGRMQAFAFNVRRPKFADPRLRRAFNFAFDFEEMNKQIFFGQYKRIDSYFYGTELACSGLPQGREKEILDTVRDAVPAEVFTTPYTNPVGGNPEQVRANLREALRLARDAGFDIRERKLVDTKSNEPLSVEFLVDDPASERFVLFYKPSLERLGIAVTVRQVDDVQYENRLRNFDFDIVVATWGQSLSPGNEQRDLWGSPAADRPGSRNLVGIKDPAIDKLIDRVIFAKDRDDLVAATRALDRVLLWHNFVVPNWSYPFDRTARWDRFGHPDAMPKYGRAAFPTIWWWDEAKAAKTRAKS